MGFHLYLEHLGQKWKLDRARVVGARAPREVGQNWLLFHVVVPFRPPGRLAAASLQDAAHAVRAVTSKHIAEVSMLGVQL